jgi:dienelactone hydrolase
MPLKNLTTAVLWCALAASSLHAAAAPQPVQLPSLDRSAGLPVLLPGFWFAASGTAPAPAMVLMHGCGGPYDERGQLGQRYVGLAARLNALGIHVLVTDSLSPRGERELCTQKTGSRRVTQLNRRRDALGALAWLATQPAVDATRLGVLGWSNGGSTVLASTNLRHDEVRKAAVKPSLAVAFYPGCDAELARGYEAVAPLLLLLGAADDWTPAAPCQALAAQATQATPPKGPPIQLELYADAYHGFDGTAPVRLRRDVPNGVRPGQGVHVGANPQAREAAGQALEAFLRAQWQLR